ncbi:MAG: acyl-CoA dehydrogenase family protein [Paenirhodobacter sp.]|uniref:acyl-CoA dehydrogenase family protein n=1 Tax=Paenirhodobacter sp. TaxID=1965326 RepID=UPI003D0DD9DB
MPQRLNGAEIEQRIASRVGTPFYMYDAQVLRQGVRNFQAALPGVDLFYSLKSNPNLSVTRVLYEAGAGCEVSSLLELETALAAGASADRILMVGPGKSRQELSRAVGLGIKAIVAESLDELAEIDALARGGARVQPVALRINPDFASSGAKMAMSGRATQFGIDQSQIATALRAVRTGPNLRLAGIHVYMGTRILAHDAVAGNIRRILALVEELGADLPAPLDFVDVGGGFGIPYYDGEAELDLAALGQSAGPAIAGFTARHPQTRVTIELGRYLSGPSGRFVTAVRQVKTCKGENFAVCDGGSNVHAAAAGNGSFLRKNFPIRLIGAGAAEPVAAEEWTLTGPLCTPQDVIGKSVLLPRAPQPGDLIAIAQSGAYGPSASPTGFLGFGAPAEVLVDGEALLLVRARDDIEGRLAQQRPRPLEPLTPVSAPVSAPAALRGAGDAETVLAGTPFADPALDHLATLETLFCETGAALDRDPEAWQPLWADPLSRALTTIGVPDAFNCAPLGETALGVETCGYGLHVAMVERLARFDANAILAMPGPSLSGGAVRAVGSPQQIERFFRGYLTGPQATFFAVTEPQAGSDASSGQARLSRGPEGWRLNGTKMFIGGAARAGIGLVFCRNEETGRPVLVMLDPHAAPETVAIERLPTTGLRGADLCRLTFTDTPVGEDMVLGAAERSLRDGFMAINGVFERNRPMVAALALGSGRGLLDRLERLPGQAGRFEALRASHLALLRQLARVIDAYEAGRPKLAEISRVKMQAVAFADRVAETAFVQMPAEVLADPDLARRCRDLKAFEYMEGTTHIQMLNAFRSYTAGVAQ